MQDPIPNTSKQQIPWPVRNTYNLAENYADGPRIRVRCIHPPGIYYDFIRRREGDVFDLIPQYVTVTDTNTGQPVMEHGKPKKRIVTAEEQFSERTMERIGDDAEIIVTTSQQALRQKQDELDEGKRPARGR